MSDDQGERTEQATDAKREEFRRQGQVAQTRELGGALVFLAAAGSIWFASRFFANVIQEMFIKTMGNDMVEAVRQNTVGDIFQFCAAKGLLLCLPVVGAAGLIGVISQVMQTGFLQVEGALSPDINRINPISGFGKMFSLQGLVEGLKSLLKLATVAIVLYLLLKGELSRMPLLVASGPQEILVYIGTVAVKLLFGVGLVMFVLAAADYFFQRWNLERKMMMTKQEIKEESKQREGDPHIKAKIRRIQREMSSRRMMDAVPKADVVITNPTHIAVVLKYSDNLPAPQIVAMGADMVAERIKALARENNIPIVENKPLARTIFKTLKIGQVIPRELFVAVAEVLSFVYKLRRKKGRV